MKKMDLGTGQVVTFRNGFKAMVYRGIVEDRTDSTWILNNKLTIALPLCEYCMNMTHPFNEEYDIMKVERTNGVRELQLPLEEITVGDILWERPKVKRISRLDIQHAFSCDEFVIVEEEDA